MAGEDKGLVTNVGPIQIDWPRSIGFFGALGAATARVTSGSEATDQPESMAHDLLMSPSAKSASQGDHWSTS